LWLISRLRGEDKKKWIVWACLFFLGLSIVLFPVALRNKIVGGDFALTTAQFGPNFYMGNHHNASGMYEPLRGGRGSWRYEQQDAVALAEKAIGRKLSPNEVSRYWTQKTLDEILSNPGDWINLMGKKWLLFWNFIENSDTESQYAYEIWSDILTVLGSFLHFGVIASLAIFGICITANNYRQLWLLYLLVVFYSISVTLFFIFSRYRLPLLPILVMFAAAGIVQGFVLLRKKRIKVLTLSTAIALIGAMIFNWKIIPQDQEHFRALSLGNMCTESLVVGKAQQAVEYCLQSLKYDSRKVKVLNNLGAALIEEKRFEEALPVLQRAVKINPKIAKVHYNLEVVQSHIRASQTASHQLSDACRMKPEE
jgi:tetratricopeptide (TPR) repeat protein